MEKLVILNGSDNVAVATTDLTAEDTIDVNGSQLKLVNDVPAGNKLALRNLSAGANIVKLGQVIGHLTADVRAGQLVNEDNLASSLNSDRQSVMNMNLDLADYISKKTFMGYRRKSGKVGIRNDLFIVPTVGCITPLMDVMVQQFKAAHPDNGSFDNIVLLKHPYGCSQLGEDFEQTRQILCDAALHPNAGGVFVFGLGCENNQMAGMKETIDQMAGIDPHRMKFLVAQEVKDEFANAQQMLEELNEAAANDHREPVPLSELKVGLQSVKPDALAPVTADRLLANLADTINANGGSTVLTGVPELAAAQGNLLARSNDRETAEKVADVFDHMQHYYGEFDQELVKKPGAKDKANGVTTAEELAANATQKAGHALITDALRYGHKVTKAGLNLLEAPDNDLIDSSAEAAADCQMVVVSTGVATPYASFVPSIKVATNSELATKKQLWIDFDGGKVLTKPFAEVAAEFIDYIIAVASGTATNNEKAGLHGLAIFKIGVTE
ncbi:altronate dehydratase [Limosilactobacillus caccae]|uniref:altronate dehydratase n=1 Tax=Limosilactobacillus caccae TaxID=1926284 RepID=UPI00097070E4|nr:altronate dehydratase [Limosilactobacillus caccae]